MTKLSEISIDQLLDKCCDFLAQDGIEGLRLKAYKCPAGVPTIGIGLTVYKDGFKVKLDDVCTKIEAYDWCKIYIKKNCLSLVNKYYSKISDVETFVALISLSYNSGKLGESTVAALSKPILNKDELAAAFRLYNKIRNPKTGQLEVCNGLVNRREKEIKYFMEVK